jgi:hypothetical protein
VVRNKKYQLQKHDYIAEMSDDDDSGDDDDDNNKREMSWWCRINLFPIFILTIERELENIPVKDEIRKML